MRFSTPPAFAGDIEGREGAAGRRWLQALPAAVDDLCDDWGLRQDGSVRYGYVAVVLPVRTSVGARAALKVTYPGPDQAPEAMTLAAWDGDGAVRLLRHDASRWALLLERLDPTRNLCSVPMAEAIVVIGGLLSRLHQTPPPSQIPRLSGIARRWGVEIRQAWPGVAPPWPPRLLDEVVETCTAGSMTTGRERLLHVDLHFENVLAGDREPWLAIDPKGLAGDPAFESVAVLWTRMAEYADDPRAVRRRLAAWCEAAEVAREPARAWARARIVEDALDRLSLATTGAERDLRAHEFLVAALGRRP